MCRRGVYPGSFDPLTVAHLAIADAARDQCGIDELDLVISRVALGKQDRDQTPVAARVRAIRERVRARPWVDVRVTDDQLLSDIARGYDVLVVGADKWAQLHDPAFYDSPAAMARALERLPEVAVAPRAGAPLPHGSSGVVVLAVDEAHHEVSSTAVREGRREWRA